MEKKDPSLEGLRAIIQLRCVHAHRHVLSSYEYDHVHFSHNMLGQLFLQLIYNQV